MKEKEKEEKGKEKDGGGQSLLKREHSECAQVVLLVAADEGVSCQNPKDRPVQMPKY